MQAQATVYWDTDKATAGAGGTSPSGAWTTSNSSKNWTSSAAGTNKSVSSWTDGDIANFSAGTNATGAFTATLGSNVTASGITIDEGTLTIAGANTLTLSSAATISTSTTLTISSDAAVSAGLTITGGGAVNFTSTLSFGGDLNLDGSTLKLTDASISIGTLNITGDSVIDFGGATTINVGTLSIASGASLTINGWANAVDYFYAASFPGTMQDIQGDGNAAQVTFAGWSSGTTWQSLDNQINPLPEPSTYGALFLGLLSCGYLCRRRNIK